MRVSLYAEQYEETSSTQYPTLQTNLYPICWGRGLRLLSSGSVFSRFMSSVTEKFTGKHQVTLQKFTMRKSYVEDEVRVTLLRNRSPVTAGLKERWQSSYKLWMQANQSLVSAILRHLALSSWEGGLAKLSCKKWKIIICFAYGIFFHIFCMTLNIAKCFLSYMVLFCLYI